MQIKENIKSQNVKNLPRFRQYAFLRHSLYVIFLIIPVWSFVGYSLYSDAEEKYLLPNLILHTPLVILTLLSFYLVLAKCPACRGCFSNSSFMFNNKFCDSCGEVKNSIT